jgi:hypothetical protein
MLILYPIHLLHLNTFNIIITSFNHLHGSPVSTWPGGFQAFLSAFLRGLLPAVLQGATVLQNEDAVDVPGVGHLAPAAQVRLHGEV